MSEKENFVDEVLIWFEENGTSFERENNCLGIRSFLLFCDFGISSKSDEIWVRHSTEVAFALLILPSQVRILVAFSSRTMKMNKAKTHQKIFLQS